ncbi:MAG: energy transducer TonB [Phenylobacterium sp.]
MRRVAVSPAAMGSLALHGGAAVLLLVSWNWTRDLKVGAVVPVTLVASLPDARPAVQAPEVETAQTEAPVPEAPPQAEPPPAPAAKPAPAPTAPTEKPALQKPPPPAKPAEKSLDFDALSASLSKLVKASPKPSSAPKGPARPETAVQPRPALGAGLSGVALSGLTDELQRRWNPNCEVEGGRDVQVRVRFVLGTGGQVVGEVGSHIRGAQTAVSQAAADRAVRAVYAAAPFRTLPREYYGVPIGVNFNAREACS